MAPKRVPVHPLVKTVRSLLKGDRFKGFYHKDYDDEIESFLASPTRPKAFGLMITKFRIDLIDPTRPNVALNRWVVNHNVAFGRDLKQQVDAVAASENQKYPERVYLVYENDSFIELDPDPWRDKMLELIDRMATPYVPRPPRESRYRPANEPPLEVLLDDDPGRYAEDYDGIY